MRCLFVFLHSYCLYFSFPIFLESRRERYDIFQPLQLHNNTQIYNVDTFYTTTKLTGRKIRALQMPVIFCMDFMYFYVFIPAWNSNIQVKFHSENKCKAKTIQE